MTRSAPIVVLILAMSVAAASAAEKPARRAQKPEPDRRCAAEGEGFIYSKEADACVRVGGMVGAGASVGTPAYMPGR